MHGKLDENSILVCPSYLVDNITTHDSPNHAAPAATPKGLLQAVLIDFARAVDTSHPNAIQLLTGDLDRIREFFDRRGVTTLAAKAAMDFTTLNE